MARTPKPTKRNYVVNWTITGKMTISATSVRDAQERFDKMDVHRLLKGRPTSPYGHMDADYQFNQNGDPDPNYKHIAEYAGYTMHQGVTDHPGSADNGEPWFSWVTPDGSLGDVMHDTEAQAWQDCVVVNNLMADL